MSKIKGKQIHFKKGKFTLKLKNVNSSKNRKGPAVQGWRSLQKVHWAAPPLIQTQEYLWTGERWEIKSLDWLQHVIWCWCDSRHKSKYLRVVSTFNFYHLGGLSRASSSYIFCNTGKYLESTRYGRGPPELISIDWKEASNGETLPERPSDSTVHI